jgi:hypothetical protein
MPNKPTIPQECAQCGAHFLARASSVKVGRGRYCSKACFAPIPPLVKHGMRNTPEYVAWSDMRMRCRNPKHASYKDYGGRGVTICPEWDDFAVFYRDMGPRPSPHHSLDRSDNDGPYSPENCRWTTSTEQSRNRRNSRYVTYNGLTLTLAEWSQRTGISARALSHRFRSGWAVERALTKPCQIKARIKTIPGTDR